MNQEEKQSLLNVIKTQTAVNDQIIKIFRSLMTTPPAMTELARLIRLNQDSLSELEKKIESSEE
ncbi:hypothetical protein [Chryseobacterium sp. VD8]|uniref:hypothetical protein n=1 Tax=Chryseobacterium sp. VD8 TaxID=3081254 RepID=UPI003017FAE7